MSNVSVGASAADAAAGYQMTTRRPSSSAMVRLPTGSGPISAYAGSAAASAAVVLVVAVVALVASPGLLPSDEHAASTARSERVRTTATRRTGITDRPYRPIAEHAGWSGTIGAGQGRGDRPRRRSSVSPPTPRR